MQGLIDVVPSRVKFGLSATSSQQTRCILIKNVSVAAVEFQVRGPQSHAFRVVEGGERIGQLVHLDPGKTLSLQVTFDAAAMIESDVILGSVAYDYLAVLVELCRPLIINMTAVIAANTAAEDQVQRLVDERRAAAEAALIPELQAMARAAVGMFHPPQQAENTVYQVQTSAASAQTPRVTQDVRECKDDSSSDSGDDDTGDRSPQFIHNGDRRGLTEPAGSGSPSAMSSPRPVQVASWGQGRSQQMPPVVSGVLAAPAISSAQRHGQQSQTDAGCSSAGQDPIAMLASFLGEAPAEAALRRRSESTAGICTVTRRQPGRSHSTPRSCMRSTADDDQSQTLPRRVKKYFDAYDDADDRPPTPSPADFDGDCAPAQRTGRQKAADAASVGHTALTDGLGGRRPPVQRPPHPPEPARPQSGSSRGSYDCAGDQNAAGYSLRAVGAAVVGGSAKTSASMASSHRSRASSAPLQGAGHFFVDGVGWCDEFGRVLPETGTRTLDLSSAAKRCAAHQASAMGATGVNTRTARSKPPPQPSCHGATRLPRSGLSGTSQLAATNASTSDRVVRVPGKASTRQQDLNWEALGGI